MSDAEQTRLPFVGAVLCPTSEPMNKRYSYNPQRTESTQRTMTTSTDSVEQMLTVSYQLQIMQNDPDRDLDAAGELIYPVAAARMNDRDDAFGWHLAADAARLKALARQAKVLPKHADSVLKAAVDRLNRQADFEG